MCEWVSKIADEFIKKNSEGKNTHNPIIIIEMNYENIHLPQLRWVPNAREDEQLRHLDPHTHIFIYI